ncbi:MAG: hypothetical protein R3A52_32040 [Polyangiales bacterium]
MATRVIDRGGRRVTLDLSAQVLHLEVEAPLDLGDRVAPSPAPLDDGMLSASVIAHKCKQVDDGVLAAVVGLTQRGAGKVPSRRLFLARLARALAESTPTPSGPAVASVFAACRLGSIEASVPRALRGAVDALLRDPRTKPVGVYTWTRELSLAYQQDKALQVATDDRDSLESVARAIHGDPWLRRAYTQHCSLDRRLGARRRFRSLRSALGVLDGRSDRAFPREAAIFPPGWSREGQHVASDRGIHALDAMLADLRSGAYDLTPPRVASWKQLQLWSLETLALPERAEESRRLSLGAGYRDRLDELFKALIATLRETHAKDDHEEEECEPDEPDDLCVSPSLTVEPLATQYARRAESYRFLRELLDERFGRAIDDTARASPDGAGTRSLREELSAMESILRGASEMSRRELGMERDPSREGDVRAFGAWRRSLARDPDVGADARVMAPVSYDPGTGTARVWALLGWTTQTLAVSYARPPRVVDTAEVRFDAQRARVAVPIVVEGRVKERMDREAFRAWCDQRRTLGRMRRGLRVKSAE